MYSRIQSLSKWALVEPWIASPRVVPQVCIAMLDAIETAALGIAWVLLIANAVVPAICFLLEHENLVEVVGRALDGVEALRAAAELKPDLILMDIRMPRMNDFEAAAVLTGAVPNSKVVLMSGEDSPELYTNALASGADGLVFKLQFPEEFVSVLGKLFPGYEGN